MKIEHVAIWVNELETMRAFYQDFFGMQCNEKYVNAKKGFESYFLSFENGARIEIMTRIDIVGQQTNKGLVNGFAHLAFEVGGKEQVDALTNKLRQANYTVYGEPRLTGDGYYESVILDPEGNHIEICE